MMKSTACTSAAEKGNLAELTLAHEQGHPWDERTCASAAMHGHNDCLVYAHEQGCPWDERTCADAARKGHMCPGRAQRP